MDKKTEARELIKIYFRDAENPNTINSVSSQLEEITLNGKEFIELIKEPLEENYINKCKYNNIVEKYNRLKEREKF